MARHIFFVVTSQLLKTKLAFIFSKCSYRTIAQPALGVIGNIAFPLRRTKGKIISSPFTGDEFTRSLPVAPRLPTSDVRNVFPIELIFGGV